jgi:Na+-translocating ferredoxin:NAD+ oxidoreductase subunit G
MRNSYIVQAWLVILLGLCFGGALAAVQATLSGRIAQNKLDETLNQIPSLVPGATKEASSEAEINGFRAFRAGSAEGQLGWVVPCDGQGFADRIELLVAVDSRVEKITGLYVLDQKETPGLGNKIVDAEIFRNQFTGKTAARDLQVTKAGAQADHQIDAITGATISSDAVCRIINQRLNSMRGDLVAALDKE